MNKPQGENQVDRTGAEEQERLFVAIEPPDHIRQKLAELKRMEGSFNWTTWSNLHLTLRFLGQVSQETGRQIRHSLGRVSFSPFSLGLSGLGLFEKRSGAVLWAGLAESPFLRQLKDKIDQNLPLEMKATGHELFKPHISLARAKGAVPCRLREFIQKYGPQVDGEFLVSSFTLFQSDLRPSGAVHTAVAHYPAASRS